MTREVRCPAVLDDRQLGAGGSARGGAALLRIRGCEAMSPASGRWQLTRGSPVPCAAVVVRRASIPFCRRAGPVGPIGGEGANRSKVAIPALVKKGAGPTAVEPRFRYDHLGGPVRSPCILQYWPWHRSSVALKLAGQPRLGGIGKGGGKAGIGHAWDYRPRVLDPRCDGGAHFAQAESVCTEGGCEQAPGPAHETELVGKFRAERRASRTSPTVTCQLSHPARISSGICGRSITSPPARRVVTMAGNLSRDADELWP